jgi:hypothetical protein
MRTGRLDTIVIVSLSDLCVTLDARRRQRRWSWLRFWRATSLAASLSLMLTACGSGSPPTRSDVAEVPGAITLNNGPITDLPSAGGGKGTVYFHGKTYRFAIGGDGVDGSAVAIIETSGEVYHLDDIEQFAGVIDGQTAHSRWRAGPAVVFGYRISMEQLCISALRLGAACLTLATTR